MTFKVDDDVLNKVEALAAQGLSEEQIGSVIGCSRETIRRKKRDNKAFEAAIKKGKCKGIAKVTNSLFKNAIEGNLGAQVFFLKNRDRENWQDKIDSSVQVREITKADETEW